MIEFSDGPFTPEAQARLDKYGSTLDADNVRQLIERIEDYPEVIAAVRALPAGADPVIDDAEIQELLEDARGHLGTGTGCRTCVRGIEQLVATVALYRDAAKFYEVVAAVRTAHRDRLRDQRLPALQAKIDRVEAWCDEQDALSKGESMTTAGVRAALADPPRQLCDPLPPGEEPPAMCDATEGCQADEHMLCCSAPSRRPPPPPADRPLLPDPVIPSN